MPVISQRFTLSNATATRVVTASTHPQLVQLHNATKSSNNFIIVGNSGVTIANGYHIDNAESIKITLMPTDELWAVSDPTGLELHVLAVKQNG